MRYPFPDHKPLQGITIALTLVLVMLVSVVLATMLVSLTLTPLFGIADAQAFMGSTVEQANIPMASLYMQVVTSSVGFFLIPAVVFHALFRGNIIQRFGLGNIPPLKYWLVGIITMIAAGIFIQVLVQLVQLIPLPSQLRALRSTGEQISKLLDSFFATRTPQYFVILTISMALLPAVGEEVFFRGTIMNILRDFRLTPLAAIVTSGLAFAAIHMEFDNTLAIWVMGIVLGLLYYYTDSLWVCILAHFLNNFMVVAGKYAYMSGTIKSDALSNDALPLYYTLPAGLIMVGGLVTLSKWSGKKVTDLAN